MTPPASMSARSWQSLDCCLEIQSRLILGLMSDELGTTLRRAGIPRECPSTKQVQNHDTVGLVERGVREVKEAFTVLYFVLGKQVLMWSRVWLAGKPVQGMLLQCRTCIRSWTEQD